MNAQELAKNDILARLPEAERDIVLPHCEVMEMFLGDSVTDIGSHIRFLYFPITAAISMTSVQDAAHMVEVTVVGKEGCVGSTVILGGDQSPSMGLVQIHGAAIRLSTSALMEHLARLPYLNAALARYNLLLMTLSVVSVGCSRFHSDAQRVARWLITHRHRTGLVTFPFSDAFLGAQAGVDATVISEVLDGYRREGLVTRRHNELTVMSPDILEAKSCRCFAEAKKAIDTYREKLDALRREHGGSH
jgi:hypothetical protein